MLHLIRWKELIARNALPFHAAVVACVVFWTAFGFLTDEWRVDPENHWLGNSKAVALAYEFARFPDFLQEIVLPWGRAVPILGLALLGLISVGIIRSIARDAEKPSVERVLQLVLVCMLLAASASDPPRHETRYLYFVYPLAVIVAFAAIAHLVEAVVSRKSLATAFTAGRRSRRFCTDGGFLASALARRSTVPKSISASRPPGVTRRTCSRAAIHAAPPTGSRQTQRMIRTW